MDALTIITRIVVVLVCATVIISATLQSGKNAGASAGIMGGGAMPDSYYGKNKGKTREGRLALITKISAAVLMVGSVVLVILQKN